MLNLGMKFQYVLINTVQIWAHNLMVKYWPFWPISSGFTVHERPSWSQCWVFLSVKHDEKPKSGCTPTIGSFIHVTAYYAGLFARFKFRWTGIRVRTMRKCFFVSSWSWTQIQVTQPATPTCCGASQLEVRSTFWIWMALVGIPNWTLSTEFHPERLARLLALTCGTDFEF